MSTEIVYRLLCDAPHCPATAMAESLGEPPDGWTALRSADYMKGKPAPMVGRGRNRRPVSGWDIGNGSFTLHLCPGHRDAFGEHRPQTVGYPAGAAPSCACGWRSDLRREARMVGRKPSSTVEYAWWSHLPEELRWYATRQPAPEVGA